MDDDMANLLVAQLLYLDSVDNSKDITMYVNSPGGSVTAGEQLVRCGRAPPACTTGCNYMNKGKEKIRTGRGVVDRLRKSTLHN